MKVSVDETTIDSALEDAADAAKAGDLDRVLDRLCDAVWADLGKDGKCEDKPTPAQLDEWITTGGCPPKVLAESRSRMRGGGKMHLCSAIAKEHGWKPLSPLVEAWMHRPRELAPIQRDDAILAEPLRTARARRISPAAVTGFVTHDASLPGLDRPAVGDLGQATLPGFEMPESRIVPALPLTVPPSNTRESKVQLMAQAIIFGGMMAFDRGERIYEDMVRIAVTLADYKRMLFPGRWKRTSAIPMIRDALIACDSIYIHLAERGVDWRLVAADVLPTLKTKNNEPLPLRIMLPKGSERGPKIDTRPLPALRTSSAPAWRAWIRLAYIWDLANRKNRYRRVYATRPKAIRNQKGHILDAKGNVVTAAEHAPVKRKDGSLLWPKGDRPVTDLRHPKAVIVGEERNPRADLVPVLRPDEIVHLTFDDAPRQGEKRRGHPLPAISTAVFHKRLHDGREALARLEAEGLVVIERLPEGWRILEPAPAKKGD